MRTLLTFLFAATIAAIAAPDPPPWTGRSEAAPSTVVRFGQATWAWDVRHIWRTTPDTGWQLIPFLPMRGAALRGFGAHSATEAWAWVGSEVFVTTDGGRTWRRRFRLLEDEFLGQALACDPGCDHAWLILTWSRGTSAAAAYGVAELRGGRIVQRHELMAIPRTYGQGILHAGAVTFVWITERLFRSADSGRTWLPSNYGCENEIECELRTIWFASGAHYLLRQDGMLLRSRDGGAKWEPWAAPLWTQRRGGLRHSRTFIDGRRWLVHGADLRVHESLDQGRTWRSLPFAQDLYIRDFSCIPGDCLALGTGGELVPFP